MSSAPFSDAFGDLNLALDAAGDTVSLLPLSQIVEDPNNPRSTFDEQELQSLAETLKVRGVLQPIIVRPPDAAGRHMIRFGARRFRAAQLAGLTEIRAIVQAGGEDEAGDLIEQLVENEQREDLSTADLARAVDRLQALKLSQSEVARRLGRPRDQIVMLASVRDMPAELRALAPQLGVRTLYELHSAWKTDQGRTRVWLSGREPKTITQAAARELAGRPAPSRQVVRDPSDGSTRMAAGPTRPDAPAASAKRRPERDAASPARGMSEPTGNAVFEVRARGVRGELVLNNVRAPTSGVFVRLKDGSIQIVPAADIRILRMRPG